MLRPIAAAAVTAIGLAWSAGCSVVSLDELQRGIGGGAGDGGSGPATGATTSTGGGPSATSASSASSSTGGGGSGGSGGGVGCAEGTGDCDGDGTCEPLGDDPLHCGACGHDCLGGDCLDARCQPIVLWTGDVVDGRAMGIAIDDDAVYVCSTGAVRRVPKQGGDAIDLDAYGGCTRIQVAGPHVYYSRAGLVRAPRAGGEREVLTSVSMVNGRDVAVDDTHGYVVVSAYDAPYERSLVRVLRDGSAEDVLPLGSDGFFGVEVDPSGIYVGGDDGLFRVDHETFALDPDPLTTEVAPSLALHDGRMYFLGAGLWSLDLGTGEQTLLREELGNGQVVTDGEALYVTLFDLGTLWRVSLDGAEAELIADLGPGIDVPAVDDTAIYVSHFDQQRLYKIAK